MRRSRMPERDIKLMCFNSESSSLYIFFRSLCKGQEDETIDSYEGIKITPFNMKEELEEGHFDKDGMYIFDKTKVKLN